MSIGHPSNVSTTSQTDANRPHVQRRWLALAVLLTGNFVTILDLFIVNVAIPSLRDGLAASDAQVQLVLVGYAAAYGICLMNGARLGDLYGRRRIFLVGMAIFTLASVLCGLSFSPNLLIGSRVLQGVGAALLMPQVLASTRLLFEGDERRKAFGIMGAVQGVAASISQLAGGWLIEHAPLGEGWCMVFLINLPVGLLALWGGYTVLAKLPPGHAPRLDLVGAATSALGLGLILVPVMVGRESGWPAWSLTLPWLGVAVLAAFVRYERNLRGRKGSPMLDVTLFHNLAFSLGVLAIFLFYSAISSFFLTLTFLLQAGLHLGPLAAGIVFTPSAVAFFSGSLLGPRVAARIGPWALLLGVICFGAGLGLSALIGTYAPRQLGWLSLSVAVNGLGQGLVIPLALNALLGLVRDEQAGVAAGAVGTLQTVGTSVGVTIVGMLLFSALDHGADGGGAMRLPAVLPAAEEASQTAARYGHALAHATLAYNIPATLVGLLLFAYALVAHPKRSAHRASQG
ncbi:MFS transporter [Bordetella genomosp. 10]|uniref:MFS transporter n=1 Tax=Bordetella genomosp. 10 TaxID=1416804 RepID=A0A261SB69_9BORD|nr:MFS transporter [Bordetella genomosp. 10]OZI34658.1 MFS transporter [Bordetella genomosp. 10]